MIPFVALRCTHRAEPLCKFSLVDCCFSLRKSSQKGGHCGIHIVLIFLRIFLWESARTFDFVQRLIVANCSMHLEYQINFCSTHPTSPYIVTFASRKRPCRIILLFTGHLYLFGFCSRNGGKVFHGTHSTFSSGKGNSPYIYMGVAFAGSAANLFRD